MRGKLFSATAGSAKALQKLNDPGTAFQITTKSSAVKTDGYLKHMSEPSSTVDRYMKCTIPSFAFYKVTVALGKPCWELTSKLWIKRILKLMGWERNMSFHEFANKVCSFDKKEFDIEDVVRQAWKDIGIKV